jgi:D-3-phosphoglycerate dehydrogenase
VNPPLTVITDADFPIEPAIAALQAFGLTVKREHCRTGDDVVAVASEAMALIVQWAPITSQVLDALPNLRVISRLGIGYDMIDVEAATQRGIAVTNTPSYCTEEVAAHTLAMIMAVTRGLFGYGDQMEIGGWAAIDKGIPVRRPSATTVAVVGFGRIGRLTAAHCEALGFRVVVCDPFVDRERIVRAGYLPVDLEEALGQADIVTLHAPMTPSTRHLINRESLLLARRRPFIVNTCRGGLIDEIALLDALKDGTVSGAALDVFEFEPLAAESPLRHHPSVIRTPHAAWYSPEAMLDLPIHAARNVVDFLSSNAGSVSSIVNPDYSVPEPTESQRSQPHG